mmetsp:Transcript_96716/g.257050  ORF Transcript_96716/g.257050 Transcript_96716/m.257050 type:complete len:237 (-) Transcript_96716:541-1251(-)
MSLLPLDVAQECPERPKVALMLQEERLERLAHVVLGNSPHIIGDDLPCHGVLPQEVAGEDDAGDLESQGVEVRELADVGANHLDQCLQHRGIIPGAAVGLGKVACGQVAWKRRAVGEGVVAPIDVLYQKVHGARVPLLRQAPCLCKVGAVWAKEPAEPPEGAAANGGTTNTLKLANSVHPHNAHAGAYVHQDEWEQRIHAALEVLARVSASGVVNPADVRLRGSLYKPRDPLDHNA